MTIQDFQDRLCGYRPTLQQARAEFAVLVPLIERQLAVFDLGP